MTDPAVNHDLPVRAAPAADLRADLAAGAVVALVALPLCLGIAVASGLPAMAGLLTSIVAGLVATWCGSAPLTIKGPAAGLISVCAGCVGELGGGDAGHGYRALLAVTVVVGALQVVGGALRLGRFGKLFPPAVVHGMLAAIGIVILVRQLHVLLGVGPGSGGPLQLAAELPLRLGQVNPAVALIGGLALGALIAWPHLALRLPRWARVPAPLAALTVTVPTAQWLGFPHHHSYTLASWSQRWSIGPRHLVAVPSSVLKAVVLPLFSALTAPAAWWYVALFLFIGSVESMLTTRAIDDMDPWHRRADLNADLIAVGVGNAVAGLVGGMPMISEVVRSTANVAHGAHSRRANFVHGAVLLGLVALLPGIIGSIPLATLAAMLVLTGLRLASPRELLAAKRVGKVQLVAFCATVGVTLATDLLVGVSAGLTVELGAHLLRGLDLRRAWGVDLQPQANEVGSVLHLRGPLVFSNLPAFAAALRPFDTGEVVVDLSHAPIIDHAAMVELAACRRLAAVAGRQFSWTGLDRHTADSPHPLASRYLPAAPA